MLSGVFLSTSSVGTGRFRQQLGKLHPTDRQVTGRLFGAHFTEHRSTKRKLPYLMCQSHSTYSATSLSDITFAIQYDPTVGKHQLHLCFKGSTRGGQCKFGEAKFVEATICGHLTGTQWQCGIADECVTSYCLSICKVHAVQGKWKQKENRYTCVLPGFSFLKGAWRLLQTCLSYSICVS